jgi:hypothetical protein
MTTPIYILVITKAPDYSNDLHQMCADNEHFVIGTHSEVMEVAERRNRFHADHLFESVKLDRRTCRRLKGSKEYRRMKMEFGSI